MSGEQTGAPAAAGDPDEVIRLVVRPGVTVHLPRSAGGFRAGETIVGKRRDIGHLLAAGHATPEA